MTELLVSLLRSSPDANAKAAVEYYCRKNRLKNPAGEFDKAGRFYISEPLASSVRAPTRAFPYSEMIAGRSMKHCIQLLKATDSRKVRRLAKALDKSDDIPSASLDELKKTLDELTFRVLEVYLLSAQF